MGAEAEGGGGVGRGEEERGVGIGTLCDQGFRGGACGGVEAQEGVIEQEDRGLSGEREEEAEAGAFAHGQEFGAAVEGHGKAM